MGVPFEAFLPYGIMLGMFGVTVYPSYHVRLPQKTDMCLGSGLVDYSILHKWREEDEMESGSMGPTK